MILSTSWGVMRTRRIAKCMVIFAISSENADKAIFKALCRWLFKHAIILCSITFLLDICVVVPRPALRCFTVRVRDCFLVPFYFPSRRRKLQSTSPEVNFRDTVVWFYSCIKYPVWVLGALTGYARFRTWRSVDLWRSLSRWNRRQSQAHGCGSALNGKCRSEYKRFTVLHNAGSSTAPRWKTYNIRQSCCWDEGKFDEMTAGGSNRQISVNLTPDTIERYGM